MNRSELDEHVMRGNVDQTCPKGEMKFDQSKANFEISHVLLSDRLSSYGRRDWEVGRGRTSVSPAASQVAMACATKSSHLGAGQGSRSSRLASPDHTASGLVLTCTEADFCKT